MIIGIGQNRKISERPKTKDKIDKWKIVIGTENDMLIKVTD